MTGGENWQVGDLALCVGGDGWRPDNCPMPDDKNFPRKGGIYTVSRIYPWGGKVYLILKEFGDRGFGSEAFRKIRPLTDAETRQAREELGEDVRVVEVVR